MRIDIVTIFPEYLSPLGLSLPGKAQDKGLLDLHVHDLRRWTHDRHHTVDDTPYGGGAGMVMKPQAWGEALDEIAPDGATLIVTTPSGTPFTQAIAAELATREHLVFACGRYEGIDQRVMDHADTRLEVRELSIGDYVLNGGEVAALAITEAVVRLLPGFMGNAESLAEESHAEGLLEYPVYTKPATWRGLEVPAVLLSGDHGRIARWRSEESVRRTAQRRPDLAHPASALAPDGLDAHLRLARPADAADLLVLQRACWWQVQRAQPTAVPPAGWVDDVVGVRALVAQGTTRVIEVAGRVVAAVRGSAVGEDWQIDGLAVAPDLQGRGIGRQLLATAEEAPAEGTTRITAVIPSAEDRTVRLWKKAGYRPDPAVTVPPGWLPMAKRPRRGPAR